MKQFLRGLYISCVVLGIASLGAYMLFSLIMWASILRDPKALTVSMFWFLLPSTGMWCALVFWALQWIGGAYD